MPKASAGPSASTGCCWPEIDGRSQGRPIPPGRGKVHRRHDTNGKGTYALTGDRGGFLGCDDVGDRVEAQGGASTGATGATDSQVGGEAGQQVATGGTARGGEAGAAGGGIGGAGGEQIAVEPCGSPPDAATTAPGELLFDAPDCAVGKALFAPTTRLFWVYEHAGQTILASGKAGEEALTVVRSEEPFSLVDVGGAIAYRVDGKLFALPRDEPSAEPVELAGADDCSALASSAEHVYCRTEQGAIVRWPVAGGAREVFAADVPEGEGLLLADDRFYLCVEGEGVGYIERDDWQRKFVPYLVQEGISCHHAVLSADGSKAISVLDDTPSGPVLRRNWLGLRHGTEVEMESTCSVEGATLMTEGYAISSPSSVQAKQLIARNRADGGATLSVGCDEGEPVYDSGASIVALTSDDHLLRHYYWLDSKGRVYSDLASDSDSMPTASGFVTSIDDSQYTGFLDDRDRHSFEVELQGLEVERTFCSGHASFGPEASVSSSSEARVTACQNYLASCERALASDAIPRDWARRAFASCEGISVRELAACVWDASEELTCESLTGGDSARGGACRNLASKCPSAFPYTLVTRPHLTGTLGAQAVDLLYEPVDSPGILVANDKIRVGGSSPRLLCAGDVVKNGDNWTATSLSELPCAAAPDGPPADVRFVRGSDGLGTMTYRPSSGTLGGEDFSGNYGSYFQRLISLYSQIPGAGLPAHTTSELRLFAPPSRDPWQSSFAFTTSLWLQVQPSGEKAAACGGSGWFRRTRTKDCDGCYENAVHVDHLPRPVTCPGTPIEGSLSLTWQRY